MGMAQILNTSKRPRQKKSEAQKYEEHKERNRKAMLAASRSGRDIGELPPIENAHRRGQGEESFRYFCEAYFPNTFSKKWSQDHLRVIDKLETAVLRGGKFALAMPRGTGKTSLCEAGAIWALAYGHQSFVVLLGADADHAAAMLSSIKVELESNDTLHADFPEMCHPIRCLEGIPLRANMQLYTDPQTGEQARTHMSWTADTICLAEIPGSRCAGSIIRVAGIKGRIRGMKYKRSNGRVVRPGLVILDDPQTDQSARSPSQCEEIMRTINGAILGLAGPGEKIASLMPCTVIREGDVADILLDRTRHPEWNGERTKMVYEWPVNKKLWEEYAQIREECLRAGETIARATEFYRQNRAAMDDGSVVGWAERFNEDEISALQHAINLKLHDETSFQSEYQNEPISDLAKTLIDINPDMVAERVNGLKRNWLPANVQLLTSFIDVGHKKLHWMVIGWTPDFSGHICGYGEYPEGNKSLVEREIQSVSQGVTLGLKACVERIKATKFMKDDGKEIQLDRILVDCGDPETRSDVFSVARIFHGLVIPSRGRAHHRFKLPPKKKKRLFFHAYMDTWEGLGKLIIHNACIWRERTQTGLISELGTPGSIWIYGDRRQRHPELARQLAGERLVEKFVGETGEIYQWMSVPGEQNHWLDCAVGCGVAAGVEGLRPLSQRPEPQVKKRRRGGFREITE